MDPEDRQGLWSRIRRFLEPETATEVAGLIGTSMVPGVGTALDAADVAAGIQDRDPMRIGIGALAAGIPFVSAAMLRSLGGGAKAALKRFLPQAGGPTAKAAELAGDAGASWMDFIFDTNRWGNRIDARVHKRMDDLSGGELLNEIVADRRARGLPALRAGETASAVPSASRAGIAEPEFQKMLSAGQGPALLNPGGSAPTLWHGTGVRFAPTADNPLGAFDTKFMGTGEGGQMAGYGHYLGEARKTGQSYKDMHSLTELIDARGTPIGGIDPDYMHRIGQQISQGKSPSSVLRAADEDISLKISYKVDQIADLEDEAEQFATVIRERKAAGQAADHPTIRYNEADYNEVMQTALRVANEVDDLRDVRSAIGNINPVGLEARSSGSLYKVKLHEDPANFIDWDLPPHQQPDHIRDVFPEHLRGDEGADLQFGPRNDMQRGLVGGSMMPYQLSSDSMDSLVEDNPRLLGRAILKWAKDAQTASGHAGGSRGYKLTNRQISQAVREMRTSPSSFSSWLGPYIADEGIEAARGIAGLPNMASARSVAERLQERGIPGIKFFDQLSRSRQQGTRNYVVFGDEYLEIIDRFKEGGLVA